MKNIQVIPNYLASVGDTRIKKKDGYLIAIKDIKETEILISIGFNKDLKFEKDFYSLKNVEINVYEKFIKKSILFKDILIDLLKYRNIKKSFMNIIYLYSYLSFFRSKKKHFKKYVGNEILDDNWKIKNEYITIKEIFKIHKSNNIFLKIDFQGSEYRLLDEILRNQNRISGLVITFRWCDLHLNKINNFVKNFKLNLLSIKPNKDEVVLFKNKFYTSLKLSFSKKESKSKFYGDNTLLNLVLNSNT